LTAEASDYSGMDVDHQLPAHEPDHSRRKTLKIVLWILLLLVLALAFFLWWRHHEAAIKVVPAPVKITVTTVTAQKGDIGVYFEAIGTVTPVYTTSISSQVSGVLSRCITRKANR